LGLVDRQDPFDAFQLEKNSLLPNNLQSISALQLDAFVDDRKINLAPERNTTLLPFETKALLVG
jgi:hypothetical protein